MEAGNHCANLLGRLWSSLVARLSSHLGMGKMLLTFFLRFLKLEALLGVIRENLGQQQEQKPDLC